MLKLAYKFILAISLLFIITSCVKDVDFDQARDLEVTPVLEISLINFEEQAPIFYDETNAIEQSTIQDSVRVEIFNDEFVVENLLRAEFLFETTNSINRAFNVEVKFLNDDDEQQHILQFGISESPNNNNILVVHEEIFENQALDDLKATTKLILTLTMQGSSDGSTLNENSPGRIKLRSKGTFQLSLISPE